MKDDPKLSAVKSRASGSIICVVFKNHCAQTGFSLIELLVTMAVLALTVSFAIPSVNTMILNSRLTTNTDSLVSSLNYARGVALYSNANVQVCPFSASNSTNCGNDWSVGWIVSTVPTAGAATLLKSQQNGNNSPTISANTNSITFSAHGLASAQTNFTLCDTRGSIYARSVEVMTTGYIQSGPTTGQAVWNNNALACP
jgi:type IV fimbrial biogenesis protein FimT